MDCCYNDQIHLGKSRTLNQTQHRAVNSRSLEAVTEMFFFPLQQNTTAGGSTTEGYSVPDTTDHRSSPLV